MGSSLEILLVEDNPADVELTLHAFRMARIANDMRIARDGAEALEYLGLEPSGSAAPELPGLILLDLKLPRVDGKEVLRRAKSDPRTRGIPIVVLTSSREERDVVQSYDLGVNSYIVKPVDFEQFHDCVRSLGQYWLILNERPPHVEARE